MSRHNFRGVFKVQDRITTTCSPDLQRLAWEKAIRWSEALETGIKRLAHGHLYPVDHNFNESIEKETDKNKIEQLKSANFLMQDHINKIQEELNKR